MATDKIEHLNLGFQNSPKSHAEFFLRFIQKVCGTTTSSTNHAAKSQAIEYRLKKISNELIAAEKDEKQARYAIGLLYNVQKCKLEGEAKEIVEKAKEIYGNFLLSNETSYQSETSTFLKNISEKDKSSIDLHYADLCTDNAFSALLELKKFSSIKLEKFYEGKLEKCREVSSLICQHIMLFSVDKEIEGKSTDLLNSVLRKLCVEDTHLFVIESLLIRGADPLATSQKTGENAIQIAMRYKHPEIAKKIQDYLDNKQSIKIQNK